MEHHVLDRPMITLARRKPSKALMSSLTEETEDETKSSREENDSLNDSGKSIALNSEAAQYEKLMRNAELTSVAAGFQGNIFKNLALEAQSKRKLREVAKKIRFEEDEAPESAVEFVSKKPQGREKPQESSAKPSSATIPVPEKPEERSVKDKCALFEKVSELPLSPVQRSIEERKRLFEKPMISPTKAIALRLPGMIGKDSSSNLGMKESSPSGTKPTESKTSNLPSAKTSTVQPSSPSEKAIVQPSTQTSKPMQPSSPASKPSTSSVKVPSSTTTGPRPASPTPSGIIRAPSQPVSPSSQGVVSRTVSPKGTELLQAKLPEGQAITGCPKPKTPTLTAKAPRFFPDETSPTAGSVGVKSIIAAIEKTQKDPSPTRTLSIKKPAITKVVPLPRGQVTAHRSKRADPLLLLTVPLEWSRRGALFWICTIWVLWCFAIGYLRTRRPYPIRHH